MSVYASIILRVTLMLSCAMLLGALVLLIYIQEPGVENWELYRLATELYRTPAGLLLLAVIISACVEEKTKK